MINSQKGNNTNLFEKLTDIHRRETMQIYLRNAQIVTEGKQL